MRPHDAIANPPTAAALPPVRDRGRAPRVVPRRPYRVPCRVRVVDTDTGEIRTTLGETVNISPAGVALQLGIDVPIGTWVETMVANPSGEPLFLCGVVVHRRRAMTGGYQIGVETRNVPGLA